MRRFLLVVFGLLFIPGIAYMVELSWTLNAVDSGFTSAKMYIVDLDGDGDKDIVGIAQTPDDVAWYDNDGSESFTKRTIDSNAPGVRDVQVGDVDNDGDIDIVISQVDSTPDGVYWYDNDGSENFTKRTISTANNPIYISLVDINEDDELDVLAALWSDGQIIYYENNGGTPSTFTTNSIATGLTSPVDLVAADIDGDNDIDIIASHSSTSIPWYENDGSETFTTRSFASILSSASVREIQIVDVNEDGDLDMVISGTTNLDLFISDGNDNPSFTRSTIDNTASIDHFDVLDLDGDGDLDVVGANETTSGTLEWFENDGSETFTKYQIDSSVTYPWLVDAEDIDGDGDNDVVVGSNNGVELWINGGEVSSDTSAVHGPAQAIQRREMYKQWRAGIYVFEDVEPPTLTDVGIFEPTEQKVLHAAAAGTGATLEKVGVEEEKVKAEVEEAEEKGEPLYESSQHQRICERVYRRFPHNQTMIERINIRLQKGYGFVCP
ncbi:VCBS repeat-containing protein [Candidatus Peribacteria bacterium]|nr:VCBS repeat-containing protein [Candidatus Peribacteria bacterium]